jgi:hypothetical protein
MKIAKSNLGQAKKGKKKTCHKKPQDPQDQGSAAQWSKI